MKSTFFSSLLFLFDKLFVKFQSLPKLEYPNYSINHEDSVDLLRIFYDHVTVKSCS